MPVARSIWTTRARSRSQSIWIRSPSPPGMPWPSEHLIVLKTDAGPCPPAGPRPPGSRPTKGENRSRHGPAVDHSVPHSLVRAVRVRRGVRREQRQAVVAERRADDLRGAQLVGVAGRDLRSARGPRARQMERARLGAEHADGLACVDLDREPQARCRRDLGWEASDDAVGARAPLERGRPEPRSEPATRGGQDGAEWAWRHRDEVAVVRGAERGGPACAVPSRRGRQARTPAWEPRPSRGTPSRG